jgi:tetraacyldisaccharide 4'-kinase
MMVGRQRVASAQQLLKRYPTVDVIISDDGLQHYALGRDIEILMFDQRGIGNGYLLPAGPLRESAQRRRDFTILNTSSDEAVLGIGEEVLRMRLVASDLRNLSRPELAMPIAGLAGKRILAAAGIGHPERFFATLAQFGLSFERLALPDHFAYTAETFAQYDAQIILVTEKDAVKCRQIAGLKDDARIWVLPVNASVDQELMQKLLNLLPQS